MNEKKVYRALSALEQVDLQIELEKLRKSLDDAHKKNEGLRNVLKLTVDVLREKEKL